MKKLLALVLVLTLASGLAVAGDNAKPITKGGSTALLFDLGGLAALSAGNYQGGFGAKYYISNDFAVRLSLSFGTTSTTFKNGTPAPLPVNTLGESKYTSTSFGVAPGIQVNIAKSNAVLAYVGAQVGFTSTSTEQDGTTGPLPDNSPSFSSQQKAKQTSTNFGAAAFIGVEWFAWDNISLSGEYRLGFSTNSGKQEVTVGTTTTSVDSPTTSGFNLGSGNAAALTLAVYF
jgi:opacity protein-like surface antigen